MTQASVTVRRQLALAGIPAGMVARNLRAHIRIARGADREIERAQLRSRNAAALRRQLGELKGGALKAGQLLSTVESLFPADPDATWASALAALQDDNPALPFAEIEPIVRAEIGTDWRQQLQNFDPDAVAAASLGQVHRATFDGRDVAVKIQYPSIREQITADLTTLTWLLRAAHLVARGLVVPPVMSQLRNQLLGELDYEREATHQNRFVSGFATDADIVIPRVRMATSRVLVTDWLESAPLVSVAKSGRADQRDAIGASYQRFLLSAPERAGLLHADPHPGNFRLVGDDRLGVLDFGAVVTMPGGMPNSFGRLIRVMLATDAVDVAKGLQREGFIRPGTTIDAARLASFLAPFSEPARSEVFTYSPDWLRAKFTGDADDPRNPDYAVAMKLTIPPEQLLTHRVWLGCVGVLCQLGATIEVAPVLNRWLPGFANDKDE